MSPSKISELSANSTWQLQCTWGERKQGYAQGLPYPVPSSFCLFLAPLHSWQPFPIQTLHLFSCEILTHHLPTPGCVPSFVLALWPPTNCGTLSAPPRYAKDGRELLILYVLPGPLVSTVAQEHPTTGRHKPFWKPFLPEGAALYLWSLGEYLHSAALLIASSKEEVFNLWVVTPLVILPINSLHNGS